MNNNLPDDILCYRLKTKRQKIQAVKKDLDKKLLALNKERKSLYQLKYNLGWENLNPPVIRGFKRNFIVRNDVARSKDGEFFEQLLLKINTIQLSPHKDFTVKKRKLGKKIKIPKPQDLQELQEYDIVKLKLSEIELRYFDIQEKYLFGGKHLTEVWVMNEPWRYVLKVSENIIKRTKIKDVELEKRVEEIDDYFEKNNLIGRLRNLLGKSYKPWNQFSKPTEINTHKNKSLMQILNIVTLEK